MDLRECFEEYRNIIPAKHEGDFLRNIVSCIGAGFYAGLTVDQLHKFIFKKSNALVALKNENATEEDIAKTVNARASDYVYPKEVMVKAFTLEEVKEYLRNDIFKSKNV